MWKQKSASNGHVDNSRNNSVMVQNLAAALIAITKFPVGKNNILLDHAQRSRQHTTGKDPVL